MHGLLEKLTESDSRRVRRLAFRLLLLHHGLAANISAFRLWLTVPMPTRAEVVYAEVRHPKLYKMYTRGVLTPREFAALIRQGDR